MHEPELIAEVRRELERRGLPARYVRRATEELSDHWEELVEASLREGAGWEEARAAAAQRLGVPATLAANFSESMRRASWFGRHAALTFFLLPPVALALWLLLAGLGLLAADWVCERCLGWGLDKLNAMPALLQVVFYGAFYPGFVLVPLGLWWLARHCYCRPGAVVLGCLWASAHGALLSLSVRPHFCSLTYGAGTGDWLAALLPVGVLAVFLWSERRRVVAA